MCDINVVRRDVVLCSGSPSSVRGFRRCVMSPPKVSPNVYTGVYEESVGCSHYPTSSGFGVSFTPPFTRKVRILDLRVRW